jgi:hypothetical protein
MATRSTIALEYADLTIDMIYCHWDGYLENNGRLLLEHWTDPFKVRDLMDLGSISALGKEIGTKQNFDDRSTHNLDWCLAYGRDRGEVEVGAVRFPNYQAYLESGNFEEFNYIFRKPTYGSGVWYVSRDDGFVQLSRALDRVAVEALK